MMDAIPPPPPGQILSIRDDQCLRIPNAAGTTDTLCLLSVFGDRGDLEAAAHTLQTEHWKVWMGGPVEKPVLTIIVAGAKLDQATNLLRRLSDGTFGRLKVVNPMPPKAGENNAQAH
jgi:hypothetical protein